MKTILSVLVIFCLSTGLSYAISPDSIVGIWLFDEGEGVVTADSSGNGHDGELIRNVVWAEGKFGSGLSCTGVYRDRVEIPHAEALTLSSFTMAIWVKLDQLEITQRLMVGTGLFAVYPVDKLPSVWSKIKLSQ